MDPGGVQQCRGAGPPHPGTHSPAQGVSRHQMGASSQASLAEVQGLRIPGARRGLLDNLCGQPGESGSGCPSGGVLSLARDRGSAGMTTCHHSVHPTTSSTARTSGAQRRRAPCAKSHSKLGSSVWDGSFPNESSLSPRLSHPATPISQVGRPAPKSVSGYRLATSRDPGAPLLGSSLVGFPRACGGRGRGSPDRHPLSSQSSGPASSAPTPQGQREGRGEAGVPRRPPTAPGSAHMAKSHRLCPAHETHLTQNLFQLLQLSLAAVKASLRGASTAHTPPGDGEGAHTNNGVLWNLPPRPPGLAEGRRGTVPCPAWGAGASLRHSPATFSLGRPTWAPQSCFTSLINRQ